MRPFQVWDDAPVNHQENAQGSIDSPISPVAVPSSGAATESGAYGTRRGGHHPIEPGLVDPAWTRLAMAGIVPILLAVSAALPGWVRLIVICLLVPLTAQGWPALVRSEHDQGATSVVALTGLAAAVVGKPAYPDALAQVWPILELTAHRVIGEGHAVHEYLVAAVLQMQEEAGREKVLRHHSPLDRAQ